ncbi:HTH-type transcriptional activator RhaS [termite gut metagenome]|uniref:HTH-type transcriptional activator RhaS n=1 Tax=termite gut metagenome TaxID=433724 RepID=A0A5J4SHS5_9ZZZZ
MTEMIIEVEKYPIVLNPQKYKLLGTDLVITNDITTVPIYRHATKIETFITYTCLRGCCKIYIGFNEYIIKPGMQVIISPGEIFQSIEISNDYLGMHLEMSQKFSGEILSLLKLRIAAPFMVSTKERHCIFMQEEELNCIMEYYAILWEKLSTENNEFQRDILISFLLTMFYEIYNIYEKHNPACKNRKNRKEAIFLEFTGILNDSYKTERCLDYYASKLSVTPKHLSGVIKAVSGKTAGEWIDYFVVFEAKYLLVSTKKSIREIAGELHFSNQSFFGKYFKHHTGISPKEYRRNEIEAS